MMGSQSTTPARRKANTAVKLANYANRVIRDALIAEIEAIALAMLRELGRRARKAAADARRKARRKTAAAKARNREKIAIWRAENPEKRAAQRRSRKALQRGAEGRHTEKDILALAIAQKGCCAVCKGRLSGGHHVDHVVPLAAGGGNGPDNLQLLCPQCNMSKGAKHPVDFMQERGYLI